MDEISQGPKKDFRLPSVRWLVLVTVVGLVAAVTTLALTAGGGRRAAVPPTGSTPPSPAAAPGTVLLTCDPGGQSQLAASWRAGSPRAGPLWFIDGRQLGYVHDGGWQGAARAIQRPGKLHLGVMMLEVMPGSTVVMKPAAADRSYFHFVDGFGSGVGYNLPAGDTGLPSPRARATWVGLMARGLISIWAFPWRRAGRRR